MRKKCNRKPFKSGLTHPLIDVVIADCDKPIDNEFKNAHNALMMKIIDALDNRRDKLTAKEMNNIIVVVSLYDALVAVTPKLDACVLVSDPDGMIPDIEQRIIKSSFTIPYSLDDESIFIIKNFIEKYDAIVQNLDQRTMTICHRYAEKKQLALIAKKKVKYKNQFQQVSCI